jgi:hypothetical protein
MAKKSPLAQKIKEVENKQKELKKLEKVLSKDVLSEMKSIITSATGVEAIRWSQYIPGFNDGEPCEFSINDLEIKFHKKLSTAYKNEEISQDEEDEDNQGFISADEAESFIKKNIDVMNFEDLKEAETQVEAMQKYHGVLVNLSDFLQNEFGANVQITLTKKGIETEDYDCGF